MIAAIRYRKNNEGQLEYRSSGVHDGNTEEFLAKVEEWNKEHEDDKYKTYDDPLVVQLVMKLIDVRQKNDESRLSDAIDSIKDTIEEMVRDLDGLSDLVRDAKNFLDSQKEAES